MKAAVIGAKGKMGGWLLKHLPSIGYETSPADLRETEENWTDVIHSAGLVVVSVPIPETPNVVRQASIHMRSGSVIMEIASLKSDVIEPLREAAGRSVRPLCVHPMFGPSTQRLDNKAVAVVPILDEESEKEMAQELFPDTDVMTLEAKTHDECMVAILSLPYLINMAYAKALNGFDLELLSRMGGSTFALQYTLSQSIVGEKTDLVKSLLYENRFLVSYVSQFTSQLNEVLNSVNEEDSFSTLHEGLKTSMERDPDFLDASEKRRRAYNAVKGLHAF